MFVAQLKQFLAVCQAQFRFERIDSLAIPFSKLVLVSIVDQEEQPSYGIRLFLENEAYVFIVLLFVCFGVWGNHGTGSVRFGIEVD